MGNMSTLLPLKLSKDQNDLLVTYSYEVKWRKVSTVWADRWDVYLLGRPDDTIAHHMSIINSFMVVLFLATVVAVILIKALRRDIAIYNDIEIDVGEEEAGWKLLYGDVFRPPSTHPTLLAVCIGSGSQICFTIIFTLLLGMTRLLNPMKKGQTLTFVVLIYVFSGSIAGYVSSRFYKLMGGKNWKLCTIMSTTLFPGVCMTLFLILNCFLASVGAATTVSFWVIIGIFALGFRLCATNMFRIFPRIQEGYHYRSYSHESNRQSCTEPVLHKFPQFSIVHDPWWPTFLHSVC